MLRPFFWRDLRLAFLASSGWLAFTSVMALAFRWHVLDCVDCTANCHGKYYPWFWRMTLVVFSLSCLMLPEYLCSTPFYRRAMTWLHHVVFLFGWVVLIWFISSFGTLMSFIDWLESDCLDYGLLY
jgi:hypothetical protein